MGLANIAQVLFEFRDGRITFPLVARGDDEDERFGLGTRLEKFIDQAKSNAQPQATGNWSIACHTVLQKHSYLFAPVTRT